MFALVLILGHHEVFMWPQLGRLTLLESLDESADITAEVNP